jgi:hypothetical protein
MMKVYIEFSWYNRMVVDVTPAELDTLTKIMDKGVAVESWYGSDADGITATGKPVEWSARVVPARVRVAPPPAPAPADAQ